MKRAAADHNVRDLKLPAATLTEQEAAEVLGTCIYSFHSESTQSAELARLQVVRELRFAVGTPIGLQAGIWRIWTRPTGDVYLTLRLPARHFKISLHRSGKWRLAYTGTLAAEEEAEGRDRAAVKWERPPSNADGTTTALEILVPYTEVVTPPQPGSNDAKILWCPPPPSGFIFVFRFRLAQRGRDLSTERRVRFIGPLEAGPESVWIETFERRETAEQRADLDAAKREMCLRNAGAFPSAGRNEVRTVFLPPNGRFVIDAVLPLPS